ncbi:polysaccharide pyruvyl transferase family protein [Neptunicella sp. SCSIO 80796]|uniref:polysaccharide pyruvyl transferase family protein n=1 Tax=Neptunicella plasticusilytica TaxID=3117012 RepID=UPI003A4D2E25
MYLLSACDRFNYGDLLFPVVAKHELSQLGHYQFHNIATIASNLYECGALPTEGYKSLLDYKNLPDNATLVVAGGQVLNANWSRLISFLRPFYFKLYQKFQGGWLEALAKQLFGRNQLSFPFMPSAPELLSRMKLVYHAVGGGIPKERHLRDEVAVSFRHADYISVRETDAQRAIKNNFGLNAVLVPDSVMVLSDIQPKSVLPPSLTQPYACVQFGFHKSDGKQEIILNQLRKIYRQQKLAIGLLSIGNCAGHDDQLMVQWIKKHADFPVHVLPCQTIDQITSAIANATIYIGTSLHGVIVSMSYGNPFVAVNKAVKKVQAYTMVWAPDYLKGCVPFYKIAAATQQRLSSHIGYEELVVKQKKMVRESFKKICQVIEK